MSFLDEMRMVANELQDPRMQSNIKGILTGKSREERIDNHKNLDKSKSKDVYYEKRLKDHEILWSTFVGKPEGNDYKNFLNASINEKAQILKNAADDTDDTLWRSKEWMRISGDPKAEEDYIPSALEYDNPFTRDLPNGNTMMPEDFR